MKQLTSYNRVAGYLNKLFDLLNQRFFESALSRPTITIQSTPRAYGHFSMRDDTWVSVTGSSNEINIGAGTLARPIENVCATLLHEMVHYYCHVNGIKDTSRGNTYHNKRFKEIAESHGLTVSHHEKYGWTITEPNDELLKQSKSARPSGSVKGRELKVHVQRESILAGPLCKGPKIGKQSMPRGSAEN